MDIGFRLIRRFLSDAKLVVYIIHCYKTSINVVSPSRLDKMHALDEVIGVCENYGRQAISQETRKKVSSEN